MLSKLFRRRKSFADEKQSSGAETADHPRCSLHNPLVPCVLVVGEFREGPFIEFAKLAWEKISDHYSEEGLFFGPAPNLADFQSKNISCEVAFKETTDILEAPCLFPIPVNDFGKATGPSFQMHIFELFKSHNIIGIISCGTAESNIGLAEAVSFIDVPVLLVLDSTLDGPERFVPDAHEVGTIALSEYEANSERVTPNALQLIPNNALQAQAILSKVGVLSTTKRNPIFHLLCAPADDPYVKDLRSAVESNLEETNRSKIRPEPVDINRFQIRSSCQELWKSI